MNRDLHTDPRWWDSTDEGMELRMTYGPPSMWDLDDLRGAARAGDEHAIDCCKQNGMPW